MLKIIRLGTRQYFEFIFIVKDNSVNDNIVNTGRTFFKPPGYPGVVCGGGPGGAGELV